MKGKNWLVFLIVLLAGISSCRKTAPPATNPITPLQSLINTDTSFSLYHRMLLIANESGLLADNSVTLLIPTNDAFRAAGYSEGQIDSLLPSVADRLISYHFITQPAHPDSNGYAPYPTHLNFSLFGEKDAGGQIWFNGSAVTGDTLMVGKALIYRLSSILLSPQDSLIYVMGQDSTLSFTAELFRRTGLDTLPTTNYYTVLTPTNTAWINAGYDSVGAIDSADLNTMLSLAKFHVLPGQYFSNQLAGLNNVVTLQGSPLSVSMAGGVLQFKGNGNASPASVLTANQPAGNSFVIYKIDEVLSP
ncbi:MAG TPA: fasciclin domain-containing protein [Puia sp.]|nr:fasciclin domain-containing protein [Puia sp.]